MGREVKRVPLDFDWPINEVWKGYLLPEELRETPVRRMRTRRRHPGTEVRVEAITNLFLTLDEDRRSQHQGRPMHPYLTALRNVYTARRPGPEIADLGTGLAGREMGFLGHDSIDQYRATSAVIKAAGLDPETWGICPMCQGHGAVETYPGQRDAAEAWEPTEPPEGDGWQLWETVSEGSPITEVYPSRDQLIAYLMSPANCWGISRPLTREQAEAFVGEGWAPSMITVDGRLMPGAAAIGDVIANNDSEPS